MEKLGLGFGMREIHQAFHDVIFILLAEAAIKEGKIFRWEVWRPFYFAKSVGRLADSIAQRLDR